MMIVGASDKQNETQPGNTDTLLYNIMHDKTKPGNARHAPEQYVYVDANLGAVFL